MVTAPIESSPSSPNNEAFAADFTAGAATGTAGGGIAGGGGGGTVGKAGGLSSPNKDAFEGGGIAGTGGTFSLSPSSSAAKAFLLGARLVFFTVARSRAACCIVAASGLSGAAFALASSIRSSVSGFGFLEGGAIPGIIILLVSRPPIREANESLTFLVVTAGEACTGTGTGTGGGGGGIDGTAGTGLANTKSSFSSAYGFLNKE